MPLNHSSEFADLTDDQYILIGKIIIEFSNLEFLLGNLLSRLLIMPEFLGRTYNDLLMADKLIKGIENAIEIHQKRYANQIVNKITLSEIQSLISQIKEIKSIRNKFSHYCWNRWDDSAIFGTRLSGKVPNLKKPNDDTMTITIDDLFIEYQKAYNAVEKLSLMIEKLPKLEEDKSLLSKLRLNSDE
jgi:hypothetical protein